MPKPRSIRDPDTVDHLSDRVLPVATILPFFSPQTLGKGGTSEPLNRLNPLVP